MKRFISNKKTAYISGIILFVILWQIFALLINERVMVFPGPLETVKYAVTLLGRSYTYRCMAFTLRKMLCGFAISFIYALILGMIAGNSTFVEEMLKPILVIFRAIPTASLIYLFIVLAGFRNAPMLLVMMISFPIIYEGVKEGIKNVDEGITDAAKVDGSSLLMETLRVRLPLASPYIIAALASSFSLSFKIEIMAEVITGASNAGLGSVISGVRAADPTNMVPVFGYSFIAVVMMLLIDLLSSLFIKKFGK